MIKHKISLTRTAAVAILLSSVGIAIYILFLRSVSVTPYRVARGTVVTEALGSGSVESRRSINVGFEVTGRVVKINVDQGDRVQEGQELAAIDNKTFRAALALAEQEIVLTESTLQRFKADIQRAQAVLKGAQDALSRTQALAKNGALSAEDLDIANERYRVATAELSRAQAAQSEGEASVLTAQRRYDRAEEELNRTVVRSPFEGVVIRREREVGDVAVPGAIVLKLAATDTVWASVWVDETYLGMLRKGLSAKIVLRSDPTQVIEGTVVRIGREVDRETRELLVDVAFRQVPENLAFGQRLDLWIAGSSRSEVLNVPTAAIVMVTGSEGVFVMRESRARFTPVTIGLRGREMVEVVEGLVENDIVLDPLVAEKKSLKDGQRVSLLKYADQEVP